VVLSVDQAKKKAPAGRIAGAFFVALEIVTRLLRD